MTAFSEISLPAALRDALDSLGYHQMTPVQALALPPVLRGGDVIVRAETGSGKTATFGLGLLAPLAAEPCAQALVVCPTRELSEQVAAEIRRLASRTPNVKVLTLTGGAPSNAQKRSLSKGAHVVVGTPGRLEEHARKGSLELDRLRTLVLDEADRLLQMGFEETLSKLLGYVPEQRQTLLFSATYPEGIARLSRAYQRDALLLVVPPSAPDGLDAAAPAGVEEHFFRASPERRGEVLLDWLSRERPESALVFCGTRAECDAITEELRAAGWVAGKIHGGMPQEERTHSLRLFDGGSLSVLVATDVAARGWDVTGLAAVVNLGLPNHPHVYRHRVGRTGRAGRSGLAISLVSPECEQEGRLDKLEAWRSAPIEWETPRRDTSPQTPPLPPRATIIVNAGKNRKLRPGDLLGALTAGGALAGSDVGTIAIAERHAYVAVRRERLETALEQLARAPVKGRKLRAWVAQRSFRDAR